MALSSPRTLTLAALLDSPAFWAAYVDHDLSASNAWLRFLLAVPVSAAMLAVLRELTGGYGHSAPTIQVVAARLDGSVPTSPAGEAESSPAEPSENAGESDAADTPSSTALAPRADQSGGG